MNKILRELGKDFTLIFTTAYSEYAIESFEVNANGYLLKPFSKEDFNKCIDRINTSKSNNLAEIEINNSEDHIFVKANYQIKKIFYNDILYFEGLKDYIQIFTKNEKHPTLVLTSFKKLQEKLPEDQFMRTHRSYIVNLKAIEKVERNRIIFGDVYIPVSESNKEAFHNFLGKNLLG